MTVIADYLFPAGTMTSPSGARAPANSPVIDANGRRVISYGSLAKDDKRPLNGDTIFEIGSITRVFTSPGAHGYGAEWRSLGHRSQAWIFARCKHRCFVTRASNAALLIRF